LRSLYSSYHGYVGNSSNELFFFCSDYQSG